MTKIQLIEQFLDYTINLIIENSNDFVDFDVNKFKRSFSTDGQITTSELSNQDDLVVYQEDYQKELTPQQFDLVLNQIADCQWDGDEYQPWGEFNLFTTYNSPDDGTYENYDETLNPDNHPYIEVELGQCYSGDYTAIINVTESLFTFLSNFISFSNENFTIDITKAKEILDVTIFELIPINITRQARINKFFSEYEALKGIIPNFNLDVDSDDIPDTWPSNITTNQNIHHDQNDIKPSTPNVGNIVRLERHGEGTVNEGQSLQTLRNDLNTYLSDVDKGVEVDIQDERPEYESQSQGYLRINGLNQGVIIKQEEGGAPPFVGDDPFNPQWLETGFTIAMWVKFLNKTTTGTLFNLGNPWHGFDDTGYYDLDCEPGECEPGKIKPAFTLQTFTLNKNDQVREDDVTWGTWEEYITNLTFPDSGTFTEDVDLFSKGDNERFIRLVVRDKYGSFWDSHTGKSKGRNGWISARLNNSATVTGGIVPGTQYTSGISEGCFGNDDNPAGDCYNYPINHPSVKPFSDSFEQKMINHLHVPNDINEWYYIVANWNPKIMENRTYKSCAASGDECGPDALTSLRYFDDYWKWHVDYGIDGEEGIKATDADAFSNSLLRNGSDEFPCSEIGDNPDHPDYPYCYKNIGKYTHNSAEGAKCKVEIISRKDLLRAKGFKN